ncbi:hypothetical protein B0G73_113183 [Paraburkholderia sp. BL25I1N1]|nr:hypothetical protein B0G73_113183 [Paraburkholderia sp. BL25I1N1]
MKCGVPEAAGFAVEFSMFSKSGSHLRSATTFSLIRLVDDKHGYFVCEYYIFRMRTSWRAQMYPACLRITGSNETVHAGRRAADNPDGSGKRHIHGATCQRGGERSIPRVCSETPAGLHEDSTLMGAANTAGQHGDTLLPPSSGVALRRFLVVIGELVLQTRQPAPNHVDLGLRKSFRQPDIQLREARLRPLECGASCRR